MMNEKNKNSGGGMYRGVNVPVKLLDWAIVIGVLLILATMVFGIVR